MSKKNIIIIGGGFAGVSALKTFNKSRDILSGDFNLFLIDAKKDFEFIPMLADIIGERVKAKNLRTDLQSLCSNNNCGFINDRVVDIDFDKKRVKLAQRSIDFEYLIIASGAQTNFFNETELQNNCFKLDNAEDAIKIKEEILLRADKNEPINVVVIGGGYTGIEILTNIHCLLKKKEIHFTTYIVEKTKSILPGIPDWIHDEVRRELEKLETKIICDDSLAEYDGLTVRLGSGKTIKNAFCIWSAGVKTSSFIENLDVAKKKSRITINSQLMIADTDIKNVFVIGDAANFVAKDDHKPLRMAIMFSLAQGTCAAKNVIRTMQKSTLLEYHPRDLGYLIPIAQGKAPGIVLGIHVHGRLGYCLHYFMCVYRSEPKNRWTIFCSIFLNKSKGGSHEEFK